MNVAESGGGAVLVLRALCELASGQFLLAYDGCRFS